MHSRFPRWALALVLLAATALVQAAPPTLFAAASLKPALDALAKAGALGQPAPRLVYAGSSQLARQIEQGAPADLFISADQQWMDYLAARQRLAPGQRRNLLGNTLVLVAPRDASLMVDLTRPASLLAALGQGRLAIALPDSVPAGIYAKQALSALHLWSDVAAQLAPSRNVRAALALVVKSECPLGVVYGSDAVSEPRVRVVARFPPSSHQAIVYPLAIVAGHDNPASRALVEALAGKRAAAVFRHWGFDVMSTPP
ncbi:MAG TPA: molybdate ABC transporter substrate-binding protein [Rhodanobacteraceae bacterium]|nr:molybdate ABC transporter substrate-binding protein [Rhodanobacteraceae bacterium]